MLGCQLYSLSCTDSQSVSKKEIKLMSCNIFIETICQYITLIVLKLKNALKCLLLAHLFLFFTLTHLVGLFVCFLVCLFVWFFFWGGGYIDPTDRVLNLFIYNLMYENAYTLVTITIDKLPII